MWTCTPLVDTGGYEPRLAWLIFSALNVNLDSVGSACEFIGVPVCFARLGLLADAPFARQTRGSARPSSPNLSTNPTAFVATALIRPIWSVVVGQVTDSFRASGTDQLVRETSPTSKFGEVAEPAAVSASERFSSLPKWHSLRCAECLIDHRVPGFYPSLVPR